MFAQSHVTAHAEAAWLLSAVTSYGQLGRMTQFKEKGDRQELVTAGLFTYPILMAGDILLYGTDFVPIGDDQRQHLELSRDIAERFNARFGETFKVPTAIYPEIGARIMDLQEPTKKMSTTGGTPQGTLLMLDPPDTIRKKVRSAVTDSGSEVRRGARQAGGNEPDRHHDRRHRRVGRGDRGSLRRGRLRAVQGRCRRGGRRAARPDPGALRGAARRSGRADTDARVGAAKARETAAPTLRTMYERMGFVLPAAPARSERVFCVGCDGRLASCCILMKRDVMPRVSVRCARAALAVGSPRRASVSLFAQALMQRERLVH